jgi:hypothetical protein
MRQNQSKIISLPPGRQQLMHSFSNTTWSQNNYLINNPILEAGSALNRITVTLCKTNEKYFADASMSGILWKKN